MASLLGGEYCIESLRQDVKDLQNTLTDVHSRVGQVKYQSWKFPDKASCDVDITELLQRCEFNKEDDEECQMSHVMLYDIVIDRLVYLLQSFICYNEILLDVDGQNGVGSPIISPKKSRNAAVRSMSVGLTVKKCWGRMTQIASLMQKLAKEVNIEINRSPQVSRPNSKKHYEIREEQILSPLDDEQAQSPKNKDISCDVRTISCQTSETAYSTCETCSRAQGCLNEVGKTIVNLCKAQNLPTALEDYQERFNKEVPMSIADLVRWGKHQSKDLSRISRHMTNLMNQVVPLKTELANAIKKEQNMKTTLNQSQSVYERKEAELKEEYRRREYQLKEVEKTLKKKISTLEGIQSGMKEELETRQWKISDLKDELLQKHRDVLNLENFTAQHKEEAIEGQQYKKDAMKFKSELLKVKSEFEEMEKQLYQSKQEFEKERTRNENMTRHEQMLQEKQKKLLKRLETLDEDCEKMREEVLILEEERDSIRQQLEESEKCNDSDNAKKHDLDVVDVQTREIEMLKLNLECLRSDYHDLQTNVAKYVERERLLVVYPDLNKGNDPSPMVQGSGDVLTDMRKQVEANQIRIQVLNKENDTLIKTLEQISNSDLNSTKSSSRLSFTPSPESVRSIPKMNDHVLGKPIQLWKTSDTSFADENIDENANQAEWYQNLQKSHSPQSKMRLDGSQLRPPSGRQRNTAQRPNKPKEFTETHGIRIGSGTSTYSSSSLEAYKKLKQKQQGLDNMRSSFTVGTGKRSKSGRPSSAKSALFKPWT